MDQAHIRNSNQKNWIQKASFFLGFKCLSIRNACSCNKCIWKNYLANSAFSLRPIGLLSLPETYENIKFAMDTLINHETEDLKVNGIETSYGKLFCKFTRSQFAGPDYPMG